MTPKHTSGPWNVDGHNLTSVIAGPYGDANLYAHICSCEFGYQKHEAHCFDIDKNNAVLISRLPKLLEALVLAREYVATTEGVTPRGTNGKNLVTPDLEKIDKALEGLHH